MKASRSYSLLQRLSLGTFGLLFASTALAQNLGINGNQLTITGTGVPGGTTPNIAATGIVDTVNNLPDQGAGLDVVNFGFNFEQDMVADGQYVFRFGVMLDDENNSRRLEVSLPNVTMDFSVNGTMLDGTVAGNQNITVLGRNSDNSIQAAANFQDDGSGLTFDGTGLSVNMLSILNSIQASDPDFNTIINSLNVEGHYYYTVALKQVSGPEDLVFGHDVPGTFTPFGCITGTDTFTLPGANLGSSFSGAYALQGLLSFAGSPGSYTTTPAAFTASCGTVSTPSAPEPADCEPLGKINDPDDDQLCITDPEAVAAENQNVSMEINSVEIPTDGSEITQETTDAVNDALQSSTDLADTTAEGIADGGLTIDDGLNVVGTLDSALTLSGDFTLAGGSFTDGQGTLVFDGITNVFNAIEETGTTLSASQISEVQILTENVVATSQNLLTETTTVTNTGNLITNVSNVVNSAVNIGASLDTDLLSSAQSLTQAALENTLDDIAQQLDDSLNVSFTDIQTTQTLLSQNTQLLSNVLDTISVELTSTIALNQNAAQSALESNGVNSNAASDLAANFATFTNPTGISLTTSSGTVTAADTINDTLGGGLDISTDTTTNQTSIVLDDTSFPVNVTKIGVVPESIPEGLTVLPDGSALTVNNGVASTIVPAPKDPVKFSSALSNLGTDVSFDDDGSVNITDNSGLNFSGTFAFDGITGSNNNTSGDVTFTAPTSSPASPSYNYKVNYPDGTSQNLQPFVSNDDFFDSLSGRGAILSTNRSNGVVNIDSVGDFKPDYFVSPLSITDSSFRIQNKDSTGVAYRAKDVNGDGVIDYEVISASGVQVVYGVP